MTQPLQEDLDFLAHFGVKGMKWGVRREHQTTSADRKSARKEIATVGKTARSIRKDARKATTPEARKVVAERYKKEVFDKVRSKEFRETWNNANTISKGEKAMALIMGGGVLGPVHIRNIENQYALRRAGGLDAEIGVAREIMSELKKASS